MGKRTPQCFFIDFLSDLGKARSMTETCKKLAGTMQMLGAGSLTIFLAACSSVPPQLSPKESLQKALTFYAPFDGSVDAQSSQGDARLYSATSMKHPRVGTPGLPATGNVVLSPTGGRAGGALEFRKKASEIVFFQGDRNIPYQTINWQGTVSFWLNLSPDQDLQPGYCDPLQITPRDWNDAAFFVEFGKDESPRHFRLGAYADFKVWNPMNRPWESLSMAEKPLVNVERPPFQRGKWTHVAFTFARYNTDKPNGETRLYLDGQLQGSLSAREQTYTWDPSKTLIMFGLSYIGLFDELAIFNRALNETEIKTLFESPGADLLAGK